MRNETAGDLISRSALLAQIRPDDPDDDRSAVLMSDVKKIIRNFVKNAPAVDAVVLPVKPGSVVWILNHRFSAEIEEVCIREDGVFAVWVEYDRSPELTEVWDDG